MKKIRITLKKSTINRIKTHKRTIRSLGLKKMNQTIVKEASPQILGMVESVKYLLDIEEVTE